MKIASYGAGAIGGYLGVQLALAGEDVTLIARGPHLAAMKRDGLKLKIEGETRVAHPFCTEDPAEAGPQDYVIIALKAHSVPAVAAKMMPLFGPETAVVTAQNGIPWWYFYGLEGPWRDRRIESVDPGGVLWDTLRPERAIGCVVYASTEIVAPGVVEHLSSNRFQLGEPDGSKSARGERLSKAMAKAGFKAPLRPNIRDEIWLKLLGNASFNPISVLTHATLEQMVNDDGVRPVVAALMGEAKAVGEALGANFGLEIETRIRRAGEVGAHKTSMLQDLEAKRPMELDALVASIVELGDLTNVPTPFLHAVLALARLRGRTAGCPV